METSLKTGSAQICSCCPKNLSCPKFGGAAAPLAPPARTPMMTNNESKFYTSFSDILEHLARPRLSTSASLNTTKTGACKSGVGSSHSTFSN